MTIEAGILWVVSLAFVAIANFAIGFLAGRKRFYRCPNPKCHWREEAE